MKVSRKTLDNLTEAVEAAELAWDDVQCGLEDVTTYLSDWAEADDPEDRADMRDYALEAADDIDSRILELRKALTAIEKITRA